MNFLLELFKGTEGNISSKRFITIGAFILVAIAFFANTFWGFAISQFLIDNLMFIIVGGMGISTAEPAVKLLGNRSGK